MCSVVIIDILIHEGGEMDKEKNMTQKERADSLFVSAKHISKWGCGKVCPDISLLYQLAPIV